MTQKHEEPDGRSGSGKGLRAGAAFLKVADEKGLRAASRRLRAFGRVVGELEAQMKLQEAENPFRELVPRPTEGGWRAVEEIRNRVLDLLNPPRLPVFDESEELLPVFHEGLRDGRPVFQRQMDSLVPFPTPPDATWDDVSIRFKDRHTVSIRVKSATGVFNYTQMGMLNRKNGEPTVQWRLLWDFADEEGVLVWKSPRADRRNQKRRENLGANLRRFFQIEGDPFRLTADRKGWEANFHIFPDR